MCRDAGHDDGSATTLLTSIRLRLLLVCRDSNPLSQCHWVQGGSQLERENKCWNASVCACRDVCVGWWCVGVLVRVCARVQTL